MRLDHLLSREQAKAERLELKPRSIRIGTERELKGKTVKELQGSEKRGSASADTEEKAWAAQEETVVEKR